MDEQTKSRAEKKLNAMDEYIGYKGEVRLG
jgi:hypothetical protein